MSRRYVMSWLASISTLSILCTACEGDLESTGMEDEMTPPGGDIGLITGDSGTGGGGDLDAGGEDLPVVRDDMDAPVDVGGGVEDMRDDQEDQGGDVDSGPDMSDPPVPERFAYLDPNYDPNITIYAGQQDELFECSDPSTLDVLMPGRVRRIERLEWVRNTGRENATPAKRGRAGTNPFNVSAGSPYTSFRTHETIDSLMLEQYLTMVDEAAKGWTSSTGNPLVNWRRSTPAKCIINKTDPGSECLETFVRTLLEEAIIYRPPTQDEVDELLDFAEETYVDVKAGTLKGSEGIELIMSAARLKTDMLFHSEFGEEPDAQGRRRLSEWEVAHAVSLAIGGRSAGALANHNTKNTPVFDVDWETGHFSGFAEAAYDPNVDLRDPMVLGDLIRDHIGGTSSKRLDIAADYRQSSRENRGEYYLSEGVARFFRQWLEVDKALSTFKDTAVATSKYDDSSYASRNQALQVSYNQLQTQRYSWENLQPNLVEQLDDMIARIVMGEDGDGGQDVFEGLLTSNQFYVPSNEKNRDTNVGKHIREAPRVYGVDGIVQDDRASRWRTFPATERAGVLTHPAWLAAHSDNFENGTGIIYRGKWIRESLLCDHVYPPSGDIEAALAPRNGQTARARVSEATEKPNSECIGCHTQMNPLGYPFEIYNHAGFLRESDHGMTPNGSSTLENIYGDPVLDGVVVNDAIDLSAKLAQSTHAKRCFVRQTFRYFMGRYETRHDACTLALMEQAYAQANGSFVEMLVALLTSDAFLYRLDPSALPD